jgi:hypothetical protein
MKRVGLAFLMLAATAAAAPAAWPTLPTSGFVVGRLATQDDLNKGDGVFRFDVDGKPITKPTKTTALTRSKIPLRDSR